MQKLLTPLELRVMNVLWKLKKGFVKDVLENWPDADKPAYNTVSTTIRILQDKNFVRYESVGRGHQYFPALSKLAYQKQHLKSVLENVFAGSASSLISALVDDKEIADDELNEIKDLINNEQ